MASKLVIFTCMFLFLTKLSYGQESRDIFNPMDYNGAGDGTEDDAQALMDTWMAACDNPRPAAILIPKGTTYLAGEMFFDGPCQTHHAPKIILQGTLRALDTILDKPAESWIHFKTVDKLEISGGGLIDGRGRPAWNGEACGKIGRPCPKRQTSLRFEAAYNTLVTNITLINSKGFHIGIHKSHGISIERVKIVAPDTSPNTDGVHMSKSSNIFLNKLNIATGDDCISIGEGSKNVTVVRVKCGPGHGISLGSLGKRDGEEDVDGLLVRNCTFKNTDNGVRIKTFGGCPVGRASNIKFQNIVMQNVSNPIIIDQEYCPDGECKSHAPSGIQISNLVFKNIRGTSQDPVAVKMVCSKSYPCQHVILQNINLNYVDDGSPNAVSSYCSNVKGLALGIQNPKPCPAVSYKA